MRLCFSCHHITAGDPQFCNHCGRSYDLKLCSRLHPNSRAAEVCSQCGSRELSIPQRPAPWLFKVFLLLAAPLPGLILWLGTVVFFFAFLKVLATDQRLVLPMMVLGLMIGVIWLIYVHMPTGAKKGARWIARKAISKARRPKH